MPVDREGSLFERRYQLEQFLGKGGFGEVWQALDTKLDRRVALKRLDGELVIQDVEQMSRQFGREVKAIAHLNHPHIVQLYDYGVAGRDLYLVMELLTGGRLSDRLKTGGPWSAEATFALIKPLGEALDYAHSERIIHRDVKPANILFRQRAGLPEEVVLADFGLAKILAEESLFTQRTEMGKFAGTAQYMAPEQSDYNLTVDGRADLYSLAVMAYRLLVGREPFQAPDPMAIMRMAEKTPRKELWGNFPQTVPPEIGRWVLQGMEIAREDRPTTVRAWIEGWQERREAIERVERQQAENARRSAEQKSEEARRNLEVALLASQRDLANARQEAEREKEARVNVEAALAGLSQEKEKPTTAPMRFVWLGKVVVGALLMMVLFFAFLWRVAVEERGEANEAIVAYSAEVADLQQEQRGLETKVAGRETEVAQLAQAQVTLAVRLTPTETPFLVELPTLELFSLTPTTATAEAVRGVTLPNSEMMVEMVFVPAGPFTMGSTEAEVDTTVQQCEEGAWGRIEGNDCPREWFENEMPQHKVEVADFLIDKTEVTNAQYRACVSAGECDLPRDTSYYEDGNYADHPVVYVNWNQAKGFCAWRGGRLPTEAEWEKAARGIDGRRYPWGDAFDGTRLNFCDRNCAFDWAEKDVDDGYAQTSPVGRYPAGASPYGALDMAGNVWEWTQSNYVNYPYQAEDGRNDENGADVLVLRGGSLINYRFDARSTLRLWYAPVNYDDSVGFRCASTE